MIMMIIAAARREQWQTRDSDVTRRPGVTLNSLSVMLT